MIPDDIRLFTWLDVEEVLWRIQQEKSEWPSWLIRAQAYWNGLTLYIKSNNKTEAIEWLNDKYAPRFDAKNECIILEDSPKQKRTLPIIFETDTDEEPYKPRLVPTFSRPTVLWRPVSKPGPPPLPSDLPPVIAFHSFKGGVGRTLHAIALARALTRNKTRVLLIDADLEAPGISWLIRERLPNPPISFSDFLALVHGDEDPNAETSLALIVDRLQNAFLDGIYILPAFRSDRQFTSLEIRPEDLIQGAEDPYCLTSLCARLGKALGVNAVIVDLRAGLSEMAAGFMLDPRVYRVLVTTLSAQSVQGTKLLLGLLGQMAPSLKEREDHPLPAIIIAQISEDHRRGGLVERVDQELLKATESLIQSDQDEENQENLEPLRIETIFDGNLTALPASWEEVMNRLDRLIEELHPLVQLLPATPVVKPDRNRTELRKCREKLRDFAERMVYAEKGEGEGFLVIKPLERLASDHRNELPVVVAIGAKGAGKTYTFLQCVRKKTWGEFARAAGITELEPNIPIFPFLASKNLSGLAEQLVDAARKEALSTLESTNSTWTDIKIRDYISDSLRESFSEPEWRERWLDLMAWSLGFQPGKNQAGQSLTEHLSQRQKKIVLVIDGLEDTFQELSNNEAQRTALRVLLQDVPKWFRQQPARSLGLIVFVRRDMVHVAVPQNAAQLMANYEPYALKWSPEEALRLVAWIVDQAKVLSIPDVGALSEMSQHKLEEILIPLWGRKLGHDRSKEARSSEWVIAALSDFRGQIQARDLVRLIFHAARHSVEEKEYWSDRILAPSALKKALPDCSEEKIREIATENPSLKRIFERLYALPNDKRQIPFTPEKVGLSYEDIKILEDNGVVLREKDEYYMPEIFRFGLGFQLSKGARPRVLYLARRARKQVSI